ncbi:MAG: hypothetical protein ACI4NG_06600 [Candidatus Gallimonas sp.]
MKSNVCNIGKDCAGLDALLKEADQAAEYNKLGHKQALRLRLLTEELAGMLSGMLENYEGRFWIESEGAKYELHVELTVSKMSREKKGSLIAVSSSRKNAAAVGFMGKIREAVENMTLGSEHAETAGMFSGVNACPTAFSDYAYPYSWSLAQYRSQLRGEDNESEWDALEKSVVAKLADDVVVGVKGKDVAITIKKSFE